MNKKRNTLRKVVGVSAITALAPSSWTKPVLNSVVLRAHAQISRVEISVQRSLTISNTAATEFSFDEQAGELVQISTAVIESNSGFNQAPSRTEITVRAKNSEIKGANVINIGVYSNYSETYTTFTPPTDQIGVVKSINYDDFTTTSGLVYGVTIDASYRASDNRAVIAMMLMPK